MKISLEDALEKKLENKDAAPCTSEFFGFWICSRTSQGHIVTAIPRSLWCLQYPKGKSPSLQICRLQRKSASGHKSCSPSSCQNACMLSLFTWVLSGTFKWGSYIPATKTSPLRQSSCRKYLTDSNRCATSIMCISIILFSHKTWSITVFCFGNFLQIMLPLYCCKQRILFVVRKNKKPPCNTSSFI